MNIAILKYNAGNIRSVDYALRRLGVEAEITADPERLRSADTALTDYATANMIYLGFNTQRAPLSDASLRSALAGAIDRATITTGYFAGHAEAARFPLSPHSSLYPTEMASTLASPDLAAALDSAGVHRRLSEPHALDRRSDGQRALTPVERLSDRAAKREF